MNAKEIKKSEALEELKKLLPANATIYVRTLSVTRGSTHSILFYIAHGGQVLDMPRKIALALDYKLSKDNALKIYGGGMDMGFSIIYDLSSELFKGRDRAGYILKKDSPVQM